MADDRGEAAEVVPAEPQTVPTVPSDTVGTGSYVAVSCTALMILATLVLIAGLLVARWLT